MLITKTNNALQNKEYKLLRQVHNNKPTHRGYFCLASFDTKPAYIRFFHSLRTLEEYAINCPKYNWYLTYNSLKNPFKVIKDYRNHKRLVRRVGAKSASRVVDINSFYVDLDVERNGMDINKFDEYTIWKVANVYRPNLIKFSGHGFYYIWFLNRQYYVNSPKFINEWKKIEHNIQRRVRRAIRLLYNTRTTDYGGIVDSQVQDPSRVLRVNNSINHKRFPEQYCQLLSVSNTTHTFMEYVHKFLPKIHKSHKKHKTYQHHSRTNSKPNHSKRLAVKVEDPRKYEWNLDSLMWERVKDLRAYAKYNHYQLKSKRDIFLFLYANSLIYLLPKENVYKSVVEMNNQLVNKLEPLGLKRLHYEIIDCVSDLSDKQYQILMDKLIHSTSRDQREELVNEKAFIGKYHYTNQDIISWLNISKAQQATMNTLKPSKDKSTDAKGHILHLKRQKIRSRKFKILSRKIIQLKQKGFTQRKICKYLNISKGKLYRTQKCLNHYSM